MNTFKSILVAVTLSGLLTMSVAAADKEAPAAKPVDKSKPTQKAKPYPLKTCVVTDEQFGGDMGEPYVFTHQGREVKLCCKSCLKKFNKEPVKYVKKMEAAEKTRKPGSTAPKEPPHNHGHQHNS